MPILAPLLIPFFAFVAAFVLVGLSQTSTSQHGSSGIKGFIDTAINNSILAQVFGLGKKALRSVVSHFAAAQLRVLAKWLLSLGTLVLGWFAGNAGFSEEIVSAVERVYRAIRPEVERAVSPVRALARRAERVGSQALHRAESVGRTLRRFEARVNARLHTVEHTVTVTLPHEIGLIRRGERTLERDIAGLRGDVRALEDGAINTWRWLNSHRSSAAMGLFAGAVAWALSRLGYGFLRCSSWRSLGRSIKCSDANILRDLLALATGVLASQISLEEFIRAAQAVENEAVDALHLFIRE